jgi:5-methylcytosine-specific restriction endonuclease McrA
MKQCANPSCDNEFTPRTHIHSFCSDECRRAVRGSEYRRQRARALLRDGFACTECQIAEAESEHPLECHHKQPLCKGGDHSLGNLQTLCRTCHKEKHKTWREHGKGQEESEVYHYAA